MTAITLPSPWVTRWAGLIPPGPVLDLAAGAGRHTRYLLEIGHPVTALDRDIDRLEAELSEMSGLALVQADLEDGSPWPLPGRTFAGVIVTNYLWRPVLPRILESVALHGVLIYETFMAGQEHYGKPSNPDFLLRPGELLQVVRDYLTVRAFEQGLFAEPKPRMRQRICAVREGV